MFESLITRARERFCPRNRRTSFALNQLDVKLEPHIHWRGGVFVEAGGNDGVTQSNTLYFEKYLGWRGLLVEAIPALAEKCKTNRPHCAVENCALVSRSYARPTIDMQYCNLMSMVKGSLANATEEARCLEHGSQWLRAGETSHTLTVPAKTLSRVLDEHGIRKVDLLSLDVEGYETEVLSGVDFERHQPSYLLVEVHDRSAVDPIISPWYREIAVLTRYSDYEDILYGVAK